MAESRGNVALLHVGIGVFPAMDAIDEVSYMGRLDGGERLFVAGNLLPLAVKELPTPSVAAQNHHPVGAMDLDSGPDNVSSTSLTAAGSFCAFTSHT